MYLSPDEHVVKMSQANRWSILVQFRCEHEIDTHVRLLHSTCWSRMPPGKLATFLNRHVYNRVRNKWRTWCGLVGMIVHEGAQLTSWSFVCSSSITQIDHSVVGSKLYRESIAITWITVDQVTRHPPIVDSMQQPALGRFNLTTMKPPCKRSLRRSTTCLGYAC